MSFQNSGASVDCQLAVRREFGGYRSSSSVYAKSPSQCAGINRHEAGNARVLRERSSEPLGPEFCVEHREVYSEA